jgi:ubiquinone/menaquinone biosynthesis C-methylase UbiE
MIDIIIAIIIIMISLSLLSGKIMDVGCSVGASTKFLIEAFPDKTEISAVDLSPHFLSAAKFFLEDSRSPMYCALNEKVKYHHALAEKMPFESDSYDIVSLSFLTHEIPTKTTQEIIAEAYRVLRPGGTISMVDLNAKRIKSLPQPRKYFFELTEPLIRQYYNTNHLKQLEETGFTFIESKSNDPMNTLWMASKVKTFYI